MKILTVCFLALFTSACVSFKPVELGSVQSITDTSSCGTPVTDICKARLYASNASQKYKTAVLENYDKNNEFDSWILNLVTLGIGAEVAELHSDVLKTSAMGLGYQSARKTYRNIPFQLQIYTSAISATQCVYDNSERLEDGISDFQTIQSIASQLNQSKNILDTNQSAINQIISDHYEELGSYSQVEAKLGRALDLAERSLEALETADNEVVKAIQRIEITILQRFNGQLPDIDTITAQLRTQIAENIELEEGGNVSETPAGNVPFVADGSLDSRLQQQLGNGLAAMNALSSMRVERYISDLNLVKACSVSI
ncbi:MAG: hypothetical protein CMQ46_03365 [Gammaproteobacteria bacterium]|nr:hypothetical protein [Gammaproteobacteria bacterium]MBJ54287.1 hypothetical protein [Gammaproteobacteria bacterium]HBN16280.1 hypothetical protein [Pseudohongiella sp.]|tara:strand:+ start:2149 stop:3087 length:939 start_codon:yes stop_codon:yes gene_type:complete